MWFILPRYWLVAHLVTETRRMARRLTIADIEMIAHAFWLLIFLYQESLSRLDFKEMMHRKIEIHGKLYLHELCSSYSRCSSFITWSNELNVRPGSGPPSTRVPLFADELQRTLALAAKEHALICLSKGVNNSDEVLIAVNQGISHLGLRGSKGALLIDCMMYIWLLNFETRHWGTSSLLTGC